MAVKFNPFTGNLDLIDTTAAAGSTTQIQYNNAGLLAGVSTMTFDGTSVTLAGRLINSYSGTTSSPAKVFTGAWFTGGTSTTTKPQLLIEPSGATSTGWSTSGTGLGINAASGFTGRLLDLQLNGTSRMVVQGDGKVGISTTAPTRNLVLQGTGVTYFKITETTLGETVNDGFDLIIDNGANVYIWNRENGPIAFGTNNLERIRLDSAGRLLVATSSDSGGALLQVNGDRIRVGTAKTPASATATGTAGEICWDSSYLYVCTATNTWKRAALSTW